MIGNTTFQDFEKLRASDLSSAVDKVVRDWQSSEVYMTALEADEYDARRNPFMKAYAKTILSLTGEPLIDFTASNHKIISNFFHRLNTQRNTYSLGNGIEFAKEDVKDKFCKDIDNVLVEAGFYALIHGVSFIYTGDKQYTFKATEFVPLWDEYTGALKAGIRFWRLDPKKPLVAVMYDENEYIKFQEEDGQLREISRHRYKTKTANSVAFGEEIIGYDNWDGKLPIVPLFGSKLKQSTLIGMKEQIDCFDLVRSGFANDLSDVAEIYWLVENYGGMRDDDLARFRDRIRLNHIANVDTSQGGKLTPYQQEIPYQARETFLASIRSGIYEDFGALDVHTVAAGATNDHIDAAYQPMDENADEFEFQIIECVQKIGQLLGLSVEDATPLFKRNRISNQKEQVEMVATESQWLDHETILKKLPNVSTDEIKIIMQNTEKEAMDAFSMQQELKSGTPTPDDEKEDEEV